jgi:hypothetical protein
MTIYNTQGLVLDIRIPREQMHGTPALMEQTVQKREKEKREKPSHMGCHSKSGQAQWCSPLST